MTWKLLEMKARAGPGNAPYSAIRAQQPLGVADVPQCTAYDGIDHSVDDDRDMLRELVRIYGKTNGFETPQTMTYGGERIRVPDSIDGRAFRPGCPKWE